MPQTSQIHEIWWRLWNIYGQTINYLATVRQDEHLWSNSGIFYIDIVYLLVVDSKVISGHRKKQQQKQNKEKRVQLFLVKNFNNQYIYFSRATKKGSSAGLLHYFPLHELRTWGNNWK